MAEYIEWRINGQPLPKVARVSSSRAPVSTRRVNVEIPGRHGLIPGGLPVFGESTITITTNPVGASQADLEQAVATLTALLAQPSLLVTRTAGGVAATARAELVTATPGRHAPHAWQEVTAVLELVDPFFRETPTTFTKSWTTNETVVVTTLAGSSAPIDPIIRIKNPVTAATLTDPVSGTGITWAGTTPGAGRWLYLDPKRCRAWHAASASQWTPGGTDVSGGLDWPAAGRLQMWPGVTTLDWPTVVKLATTGTGRDSGTELAIRAGRSFL